TTAILDSNRFSRRPSGSSRIHRWCGSGRPSSSVGAESASKGHPLHTRREWRAHDDGPAPDDDGRREDRALRRKDADHRGELSEVGRGRVLQDRKSVVEGKSEEVGVWMIVYKK